MGHGREDMGLYWGDQRAEEVYQSSIGEFVALCLCVTLISRVFGTNWHQAGKQSGSTVTLLASLQPFGRHFGSRRVVVAAPPEIKGWPDINHRNCGSACSPLLSPSSPAARRFESEHSHHQQSQRFTTRPLHLRVSALTSTRCPIH